jgi:hypothetical protein
MSQELPTPSVKMVRGLQMFLDTLLQFFTRIVKATLLLEPLRTYNLNIKSKKQLRYEFHHLITVVRSHANSLQHKCTFVIPSCY